MSGNHVVPGHMVTDKKVIILVIILFLLCLVAVMSNGLITVVLGMKWLLRRTLSPYNKLLVSLAAFRFCLQWVVIGKSIYVFLDPTVFPYSPVMQLFNFLWDFLNIVTIWLCTWLGFFYCVKIATLTHPVFLWLKYKVSMWVPRMLLGSMVLSGLLCILFFIGDQVVYQNCLRINCQSWNVTENSLRSSLEKYYFFSLKVIMWTIPAVIFVICMVVLLISLGRHMKKTLLTVSRFQETRAQAHLKALLALLSFLLLFTFCFVSLVLSSISSTPFQELQYWVWQVVMYLVTAVHPLIVLFSNPSLRVVLDRGCSSMCGAP